MADTETTMSAEPASTDAVESTGIEAGAEDSGIDQEIQEGAEVEASGEASNATPQETQDAAKKLKAKEVKGSDGERFKIKVDGQELELGKEEVIRYAQMGRAGQRAMQEKAELQKRTAHFIEALKNDPRSVLADPAIGVDVVKFAQEVLAAQLEEEALSPEQKELREAKAEIERFRKEKAEEEDRRKASDYEREVQKYEEEIQTQLQEALESEKLPRKPAVLSRVADILLTAHDNNLKISPKQAVKLAKEELAGDIKQLASVLSDEQLEELFGSEVITRVRKASLKRIKAPVASAKTTQTTESLGKLEKTAKPKIDMRDFMRSAYFGPKKK